MRRADTWVVYIYVAVSVPSLLYRTRSITKSITTALSLYTFSQTQCVSPSPPSCLSLPSVRPSTHTTSRRLLHQVTSKSTNACKNPSLQYQSDIERHPYSSFNIRVMTDMFISTATTPNLAAGYQHVSTPARPQPMQQTAAHQMTSRAIASTTLYTLTYVTLTLLTFHLTYSYLPSPTSSPCIISHTLRVFYPSTIENALI